MEKEKYNLYLDESRIDNPDDRFMVVGGVFVRRKEARQLKDDIKLLLAEEGFTQEIKWVKTDKKSIKTYKKLVDLFFDKYSTIFSFHCIVVDKTKVAYEMHDWDKEKAFFKFIYQLLIQKFNNNLDYYVFLDYKPTKVSDRLNDLLAFLRMYNEKNKENCKIKHLQSYDSAENVFIQFADLLCGAVGYEYNEYPRNTKKGQLAQYVASKIGKTNLRFGSYKSEPKFNIFKIRLD